MSRRDERGLYAAAALGAAVFFACLAGVLSAGGLLPLDRAALQVIGEAPPLLIRAAIMLDIVGGTLVVTGAALLAAAVLFLRGRRWGGVRLALIVLGAQAGNLVLKLLIAAPRPEHPLIETSGFAFPSGHASAAALLAVLAVWYAGRFRRSTFTLLALALGSGWALAMAASRIMLFVHSATDVLGGLGYGMAAASIGLLVTGWVQRRWPLALQPREPM